MHLQKINNNNHKIKDFFNAVGYKRFEMFLKY